MGTHPSCHLPWWIRMNSFVPRCKGPGEKNGAGLRPGSPMSIRFGIPGCHCHLHLAEKKSGVDPGPGRVGCHVDPHGGVATGPNVLQDRWVDAGGLSCIIQGVL